MAPPNKGLWEVLVPRESNKGLEYDIAYHQQWDAQVRSIAGGITILRTAKGHWRNPDGVIFVEEMIPVRVFCSRDDLDKIMEVTMSHYDQEAVMAYEISTNVVLKHR